MEKYREYMDNVRASDTLHQRLLGLEASGKRPVTWKKYGTMAAALVLVAGLGAWGLGKSGGWDALTADFRPAVTAAPETADEPVPDIALVAPGEMTEPGQRTIGGYEVISGSGENAIAAYYVLPYIEYGPPSDISAAASLAPPAGGLREATRDDALALVGGEDALTTHLNWGGCELSGTVGFEADGTVWMLSLWGEEQDTAFSLELSPGRLPPTCCVVMGEQRTITNVWGVEVSGVNSAGAHGDTERGIYMDVSRKVEFIANGVGCRMKAYGTQDGAVEELVSRFVRWAVLEGLDLSAIGVTQADGSYICSDCGQTVPAGTKHSHPHIGVDEMFTCPNCGAAIPAGADHDCVTITCPDCGGTYAGGTEHHCAGGTHTCSICGEVLPIDVEHSHAATICPDCGESYAAGAEHHCTGGTYICSTCGQTVQNGAAHSHSEEHHSDHHGNHH